MIKKMNEMAARYFVGGIGIAIVSVCIFFSEWKFFRFLFALLIAAITTLALWEYYQFVKKKGGEPALQIGIGTAILYVLSLFFQTQGYLEYLPEIILGIGLFALFLFYAFKYQNSIINISTTFLGIVYIGIPLALLIKIVYFYIWKEGSDPLFKGSFWLAFLILITKGTDTGAFFIGRQWGKKKLAPWISPGKTVSGAIGGIIVSIILALVAYFVAPFFGIELPWWIFAILGCLLSIGGQLGDLAESLLKRDAGVKDSNRIVGMGGVLDMIDSLLFTAPILYIFLKIGYNTF